MTEPSSVPPPAPDAHEGTLLPLVRLLPPPPEGTILSLTESQDPARRTWFFAQLWAEMRLGLRMYFDPRYRVSRTAQIVFPLVGMLLVLNYFLFSVWFSVPFFSPVAERLLDVVLVVFAYRVLVCELDRYRAVLDYLARYARQ